MSDGSGNGNGIDLNGNGRDWESKRHSRTPLLQACVDNLSNNSDSNL